MRAFSNYRFARCRKIDTDSLYAGANPAAPAKRDRYRSDCEFVQELNDKARGDAVLNPFDNRPPFWRPWLEFRDDSFTIDAEAMAVSLVRTQARTPTEEFFRESGRTLLEGIFQVVMDRGNARVISEFLAWPRADIQKKLGGTRDYPLVDLGAHEQGAGFSLQRRIRFKPFIICRPVSRPIGPGPPGAGPRPEVLQAAALR